ncbi:MAG TPA: hybrid sensor histidine kinase/response regulator, partial [Labilithrix sp.]|nr:hybrid sensor histidine kinase/response regulator [Labilithrix sp.]
GATARLVASTGLEGHAAARPPIVWLADPAGWPLARRAAAWRSHAVPDLRARFGDLQAGPFPEHLTSAIVLALDRPDAAAPYGYLVAGVSPRRTLDADYETFFELAAEHLSAAIANAFAFASVDASRQFLESREAERQALLARAEAARGDAEAASRSKDEFLAIVSHELRNPLNAMLGWTRMLRSGSLSEERAARALETIERNAVHQAQLIEDLLDVSRVISGKLPIDVETVSFGRVIEAAVDSARPAIEAKGLRLSVVLETDALVAADPGRLQQVVWNLLTNATKFTPREGSLRVVLRRDGSQLELSVSDSGQGIEPSFLGHVFDRFRQADPSATRLHGGLGLGLSIAKNLVEMHGGTIEARSDGVGAGATFVVRLPVAATPRARAGEEPAHAPRAFECPPELQGLRVLVVDDEADARDVVTEVLTKCGAKVTSASSVAVALAAIERDAPDVLISDIGMPGEDGYSLMRHVRALPRSRGGSTPAACLMGYTTADDRRRALGAGFNMHLAKPIEPAELVAVVANLTRMARALRDST